MEHRAEQSHTYSASLQMSAELIGCNVSLYFSPLSSSSVLLRLLVVLCLPEAPSVTGPGSWATCPTPAAALVEPGQVQFP